MRLRLLFGGAVFLASFLLFLVEPIAAKQLLPVLGGSAAVWITCLVFFQTALLCAYLYAHWLSRSAQWIGHIALLVLATAAAMLWAVHSAPASQPQRSSCRHRLYRAWHLDRTSLPMPWAQPAR